MKPFENVSPLRRKIMSCVRAKDTKPEIQVRKALHRLGYRFRIHESSLPGKPDLVFKSRKCIVFVHGCFWHQHDNCKHSRLPRTREDYWLKKLSDNVNRDIRNVEMLQNMGWRVHVVWECETHRTENFIPSLTAFLGPAAWLKRIR